MEDMVQIKRETLERIAYHLNGQRVSLLSKADHTRIPEIANRRREKARELDVLLDEIYSVLDAEG